MKVLNRHLDGVPKGAVYVGRGTPFGNPFEVTAKRNREQAIAEFKAWAATDPDLQANLHRIKGKDLVCSCAPLACHADVLMEMANPGYNKADHIPF